MIFYAVKTFSFIEDNSLLDYRTDAVFFDAIDAFNAIKWNEADLSEGGMNKYVAILAVPTGIYPEGEEIAWFEWDESSESYVRCDRPDIFEGFGFTI